jgi:DNA-directed RNA polymerase subunit RPC12/RpoP
MIYPPVSKSWKCPSCSSRVPLTSALKYASELGTVYRCPVCRVELMVDPRTDRIVLGPGVHDDLNDPRRS